MDSSADMLTIQKFISLLDDFHYEEFRGHLIKTNALLPLKLTEAIRKQLPHFDPHEELCKKIYANYGKAEKQNFNRLTTHTFKLSGNLAANYPEYLHPNIQKIQWLVANQKPDEANLLANQLLDIAERVNNFPCQVFSLKFLSQQAYMAKDNRLAAKTDARLREVMEDQNLYFKIQSKFRNVVYVANTPKPKEDMEELQKYYEQFNSHRCVSIRILSQYAWQHTLHSLTTEMFTPKDNNRVNTLRKEIQSHPHVVFPFMVDIKGSLDLLLLNSPYINVFAKETAREYENLLAHYDTIKYWKNYLNIGGLSLMAVQTTKILSLYHYKLHLSNYNEIMEPPDRVLLNDLLTKCKKMIEQVPERETSAYEERSVRILYSVLLILSGKPQTIEGLNAMEALLIDYQQINFKASTDSIFLCLMFGYFAMKDYEKCALSYKRYLKTIKGKLGFEGNHVKIQSYYYISQWLATGSKQYPTKLQALLREHGREGSQRTIWELIKYFKLPIAED